MNEEWLKADPFRKVKQPKADTAPKDTLTTDEVEKLLAACNRKTATGARDFAAMLLLFSTGLRAQELRDLRVGDIGWDTGLIMVQRGKGVSSVRCLWGVAWNAP